MGKLSALKEGLERAIKHIDAAKAAANAELARQFDVEKRLPGYQPPEAKVDDILGDARYFDEDGDPLQSFYDEVGRRQAALEVPQKVEGISDINSAHHLAQADAFKAMLDDAKIPYEENISSSSSRYVTVDGKKYRFSNHFKTTNPTNHARPDVNVAPGGNTFEDAIASAFSPARSINAAFDPAQKESSNLLASFAPAAVGTGLAALGLNPQETYAAINNYMQATQGSNPILENLNRNLQQFGMNERGQMQTGTMQATPHPMLGQVADVVRIPQAPGLGPLFGGAADYLDKLAQGQDVTYYDRLGAALDVTP